MKIQSLPPSINDQIQDLMMDVFEAIGALQGDSITAQDLMITKSFYAQALELLNSTDFLSAGDNPVIVKSIYLDIESETSDLSERLLYAWFSMKVNLEKAHSQDSFNACFALFVPVIFRFMCSLD